MAELYTRKDIADQYHTNKEQVKRAFNRLNITPEPANDGTVYYTREQADAAGKQLATIKRRKPRAKKPETHLAAGQYRVAVAPLEEIPTPHEKPAAETDNTEIIEILEAQSKQMAELKGILTAQQQTIEKLEADSRRPWWSKLFGH